MIILRSLLWLVIAIGAISEAVAQQNSILCGQYCNIYSPAPGKIQFIINNINQMDFNVTSANVWTMANGVVSLGNIGLINNTNVYYLRNGTTLLSSPAAATLHLGNVDAASPVAQTLGVQGANSSGTNGSNWSIIGSLSFGNGGGTVSGDIIVQTGVKAAASATPTTALTIKGETQTVVTAAAVADSGFGYAQPATGATVTINNNVYHEIIDPAGTIATLTVNMPATPINGQVADVRFSQIVTALTVSGNGNSIAGNPTSAAVGSQFGCIYRATNTTWYC